MVPPGLAITLAVIAFNFVGDGLRASARPAGAAAMSVASALGRQPLLAVHGLTVAFRTRALGPCMR